MNKLRTTNQTRQIEKNKLKWKNQKEEINKATADISCWKRLI